MFEEIYYYYKNIKSTYWKNKDYFLYVVPSFIANKTLVQLEVKSYQRNIERGKM